MNWKTLAILSSLSFPGSAGSEIKQISNYVGDEVGIVLGFRDYEGEDSRTIKYYATGLPPVAQEECNDFPQDLICGEMSSENLPPGIYSPSERVGFQSWNNNSDI